MSSHRKVLVTGATGYVGGRLVESLLNNDVSVRIFIRDSGKIKDQPWSKQVDVAVGNANDFQSLREALTGIHTAFYLLHSLNMGKKFDEISQQPVCQQWNLEPELLLVPGQLLLKWSDISHIVFQL